MVSNSLSMPPVLIPFPRVRPIRPIERATAFSVAGGYPLRCFFPLPCLMAARGLQEPPSRERGATSESACTARTPGWSAVRGGRRMCRVARCLLRRCGEGVGSAFPIGHWPLDRSMVRVPAINVRHVRTAEAEAPAAEPLPGCCTRECREDRGCGQRR
jgi:hypothetical protein